MLAFRISRFSILKVYDKFSPVLPKIWYVWGWFLEFLVGFLSYLVSRSQIFDDFVRNVNIYVKIFRVVEIWCIPGNLSNIVTGLGDKNFFDVVGQPLSGKSSKDFTV